MRFCYIVFVFTSILILRCSALNCLVGFRGRIAIVGAINKMAPADCPSDGTSYQCIMLNAKFQVHGLAGEGSIGTCVPVDECAVSHCSNPLSLLPDMKNRKVSFKIKTCEEKCCNSDNCY